MHGRQLDREHSTELLTVLLLRGLHLKHALYHNPVLFRSLKPHHVARLCYLCRPLVLGRRSSPRGEEYCIASEDAAFGPIGFTRVRDIQPGEMVIITQDGRMLSRQVSAGLSLVMAPTCRAAFLRVRVRACCANKGAGL